MSWIPTFHNILPAVAAGAVAIPALLILYFLKLRRREMAVASTLLWKKAIQDLQVNAPFQKLRRNLLLLLQMLLLVLLLLALARPVTNYTPGAGKVSVILIDRSASMGTKDTEFKGKTRLDEAKRRAKELVGTLGKDASAMVIAFDDSAETIQPFTTDGAALRRAIDGVQQTDRRSKLKLAYQLAEAQSNFNPEQLRAITRPDVWLYSDGRVTDASDLRLTGNLHYDRIGSENTGNVGIVALSARRNYDRPAEVQIFARLANFGPEKVDSDVQLSVNGQVRGIAGTSLLPDRWTQQQRDRSGLPNRDSVEFTVELTNSAVVRVEQMRKEGDALTADDAAEVIVPPPKALAVLLVTNGDYFLSKAIDSLELQNPGKMLPSEYEAAVPTKYDVIVFDGYKPKKLPPAGSFIYFGVVPDGLRVKTAMDGKLPAISKGLYGVLDWRRDHPILKGLSLRMLYVSNPLQLEVPTDDEVLVDGAKGPQIVLERDGRTTHLVVGFDLLQSTWPVKGVSFPLFMYNSMQYLALGSEMGVREAYSPGSTPKIPRAALQKVDPNLKSVKLDGPMGKREVSIPDTGDFVLPALDKVGVYTLDPPVPQYEQIAVNLLDANESNILPEDRPPGGVGEALAQSNGKSRLELWWWIVACGALPLVFIEWWVYTRRVHL